MEQRTQQLDTFLTEYRDLQIQLLKMRQACDNLRQEKVKKDMELLKSTLLNPSYNFGDGTSASNMDNNMPYSDVVRKPILKKPIGVSI